MIGNKLDNAYRSVSYKEASHYADSEGITFIEVSASEDIDSI